MTALARFAPTVAIWSMISPGYGQTDSPAILAEAGNSLLFEWSPTQETAWPSTEEILHDVSPPPDRPSLIAVPEDEARALRAAPQSLSVRPNSFVTGIADWLYSAPSAMTSKDVHGEPTAANGYAGGNSGGKFGPSRGCLSIQPFTCEFDSDLGHHVNIRLTRAYRALRAVAE